MGKCLSKAKSEKNQTHGKELVGNVNNMREQGVNMNDGTQAVGHVQAIVKDDDAGGDQPQPEPPAEG